MKGQENKLSDVTWVCYKLASVITLGHHKTEFVAKLGKLALTSIS